MKIKLVAILLSFCFLCSSATGLAVKTIPVKEEVLRQLLQDSIRLNEIIETLKLNSTELQRRHLAILEESRLLKQELAELKISHEKLLQDYKLMIDLSKKQGDSLRGVNELFEGYSKEQKTKIKNLNTKITVLEFLAGGLAATLLIKSIK